MPLFFYRLIGAATLDASMYEGIEINRTLTAQATAAVFFASVAAGVGLASWRGMTPELATLSLLALVAWVAWAVLIQQIGTRLLPDPDTQATLGQLLRTTGFAAGPGMLQIFELFRPIALPVFVVTSAWMFIGMVVAVRHALDYRTTAKAVLVCVLAAALPVGLGFAVSAMFATKVS